MTRIGFIGMGTMGLPMAEPRQQGLFGHRLRPQAGGGKAAAAAGMSAAAPRPRRWRPRPRRHDAAVVAPRGERLLRRRGRAGSRPARARSASTCPPSTPRVSRGWPGRAGARRALHRRAGVGRHAAGHRRDAGHHGGRRGRDFEEARPALAAMGANVIHVGAVGSGEVVKLCNNLIAGVAAVAVSEAFRIAEGFGVDPKVHRGDRQVLRRHLAHGAHAPGARPRAARRLQQRLRARLHDRSHVQGSRAGGECGARACGCRSSWPRPPSRSPPGLVSRLRAEGLHQRLPFLKPSPGTLRLERMDWLRRWLARLGKLGLVLGWWSRSSSSRASLPLAPRDRAPGGAAAGAQDHWCIYILSIEDIDLNLFTGYTAVKLLRLTECYGRQTFVEFERLEARLALWRF